MTHRNAVIALLAGVSCGALSFFLLYQKAAELEKRTTPTQVLLAARYIPAGVYLAADMVEKKEIPDAYVSPSAIRDLKEVDGLTTLVPLSAGEQVLSNKFGEGEETLALALNPGYRAYTLGVNETSGVGDLLRPGNRVDVLVKLDSDKRTATSFVLQNIQVLAVGQRLGLGRRASGGPSPQDGGDSGYGTVTLAVTPEQAETLMYLDGRPLRLVLRAPHDDEIVSIPTQSEAEVLSKLGHFTPSKRRGIEIIHGGSN